MIYMKSIKELEGQMTYVVKIAPHGYAGLALNDVVIQRPKAAGNELNAVYMKVSHLPCKTCR